MHSVVLAALCLCSGAAALAPATALRPARVAASRRSTVQAAVFDDATAQFAADFPWLAKYGFGPSVKAERWNGRHAMFGWFFILCTGYAKAHGLFPDAATQLKYTDWGALAQIGFGQYISNERAIIIIAHIHALAVSACAAWGPQILGDSLTLLDGEEDEEPYGLFPPLMGQGGLTPAAEMWNGRLAMLGIIVVVLMSAGSGKDILEVIDIGTGGLFLSGK